MTQDQATVSTEQILGALREDFAANLVSSSRYSPLASDHELCIRVLSYTGQFFARERSKYFPSKIDFGEMNQQHGCSLKKA
jgi:hypothetical protein